MNYKNLTFNSKNYKNFFYSKIYVIILKTNYREITNMGESNTAVGMIELLTNDTIEQIKKIYEALENYNSEENDTDNQGKIFDDFIESFVDFSIERISIFIKEFEEIAGFTYEERKKTFRPQEKTKNLFRLEILSAIRERERKAQSQKESIESENSHSTITTSSYNTNRKLTSLNEFYKATDNKIQDKVNLSRQIFDLYINCIDSEYTDADEKDSLIQDFVTKSFSKYRFETTTFTGTARQRKMYASKTSDYLKEYLENHDVHLTKALFELIEFANTTMSGETNAKIAHLIESRISGGSLDEDLSSSVTSIHDIEQEIIVADPDKEDANSLLYRFKNEYRKTNRENKLVFWSLIAISSFFSLLVLSFFYFKTKNLFSKNTFGIFCLTLLAIIVCSLVVSIISAKELVSRDKEGLHHKLKIAFFLFIGSIMLSSTLLCIMLMIEKFNFTNVKKITNFYEFLDNIDAIIKNSPWIASIGAILSIIFTFMLVMTTMNAAKLYEHNRYAKIDAKSHFDNVLDDIKNKSSEVKSLAMKYSSEKISQVEERIKNQYNSSIDKKTLKIEKNLIKKLKQLLKDTIKITSYIENTENGKKAEEKFRTSIVKMQQVIYEYRSLIGIEIKVLIKQIGDEAVITQEEKEALNSLYDESKEIFKGIHSSENFNEIVCELHQRIFELIETVKERKKPTPVVQNNESNPGTRTTVNPELVTTQLDTTSNVITTANEVTADQNQTLLVTELSDLPSNIQNLFSDRSVQRRVSS